MTTIPSTIRIGGKLISTAIQLDEQSGDPPLDPHYSRDAILVALIEVCAQIIAENAALEPDTPIFEIIGHGLLELLRRNPALVEYMQNIENDPGEILYGPICYRVELEYGLFSTPDENGSYKALNGQVKYNASLIQLSSDCSGDMLRTVLMHELIHVIAQHADVTDSERAVVVLGYGLTALLIDNPDLLTAIAVSEPTMLELVYAEEGADDAAPV